MANLGGGVPAGSINEQVDTYSSHKGTLAPTGNDREVITVAAPLGNSTACELP